MRYGHQKVNCFAIFGVEALILLRQQPDRSSLRDYLAPHPTKTKTNSSSDFSNTNDEDLYSWSHHDLWLGKMVVKKRCLLWDWTNTAHIPEAIEGVDFSGPLSSCSNWNAWAPPELKGRLPFRPTVRGMEQLTDSNEWGMISNNEHAIIHYFNEPERAGISPQKAAEMWKEKMIPLRRDKGKKIIGPGCASDPGGEAWLIDFMDRVETMGEPPDYLGVHYYGPDGTAAIQYIEKMHNKYPDYPVVVSEIASISRNKEEVFAFTAQVANWMDQCPWVSEYSFFGCMRELADDFVSPEAQLMNPDGTFKYLMNKLMKEQPMTGI